MGRKVYLSDAEVRVLNEALTKWNNWSCESQEGWEIRAYDKLIHKLWEEEQ